MANKWVKCMGGEAYSLLQSSGVIWKLEQGSNHKKLMVNGRMIAILPNSGRPRESKRATFNLAAAVRKAVAESEGQAQK
jgi:hypothetical protein